MLREYVALAPTVESPPRRQRLTESLRAAEAVTGRETTDEGFRRLSLGGTGRHSIRDLAPIRQDRMIRLCYYLWENEPLAQWLIETPVDFILGEGWSVEHDDEEAHDVLDAFLHDPVNRLPLRMDTFAREFGLFGELFLPVAANPITGRVEIAAVDPLMVDEVQTNRDNILIAETVSVRAEQAVDQGAPSGKRRALRVARLEPSTPKEAGMYRVADPGERTPAGIPYEGDILFWQTNKVSTARRGRSDLTPLIDWIDGHGAFLFDAMDAGQHHNAYVWDVKLEGMTEPQIKDWLARNGDVKRGMIRAHNEKVTWDAVAPDLKHQDKDTLARMLKSHIIGSRGMPAYWMGQADDSTQGAAKEMSLVPVKRLTRRQREVRGIITDLCTFALHMAVRAGQLKRELDGEPIEHGLRVVLPELSMRDQAGIVAAVTSLTAALQQAEAKGWIRGETSARIFAELISQLGIPVDSHVEYDPTKMPPDMLAPYAPGAAGDPRTLAQLGRRANGNGENINQPKQTTPVGGNRNQ